MNCPYCEKPTSASARTCVHCNADLRAAANHRRAALLECAACARSMELVKLHGVEIDVCPRCAGVWLDRGELELLTPTHGTDGRTLLLGHLSREPARGSAYTKCPVCMQPMLKRAHPRAARLRLASCSEHGLWFERDDALRLFDLLSQAQTNLTVHTQKPAQRPPRGTMPPPACTTADVDWDGAVSGAINVADLFDLFD